MTTIAYLSERDAAAYLHTRFSLLTLNISKHSRPFSSV